MLESIFLVAGGLGLLLFGMKMISTGLQIAAGDHLQAILKQATSNRFLAAIAGTIVTICLNSSTLVTIITVGFVNAGLLKLTQAIGVIMGANVGTTFSAQLIAFRIDPIAPLLILVGVVMHMFFKGRRVKNIGYIILGFGILLFSIQVMGAPLKEFAKHPSFNAMLTTFENPILALLAGFIFTAIIQSSSATMGLLITMHLGGVPIPFETSAFIILGTNIGTSITTLIASIPANRDSKRAAIFHITYDIIGSTVFGTLIFVFPSILGWFQATWEDSARQVAMFHTLYNVATLILLIPFVGWIAILMQKIVPVKENENNKTHERKLMYLDVQKSPTPAFATIHAHLEVCRMGKIVNENLALSLESFFENDTDKSERVFENEKIVDFLTHKITSQLILINNMPLSDIEAEKIGVMFKTLTDLERIGDHAKNIAGYTLAMTEGNLKLDEIAVGELKTLGNLIITISVKALDAYERDDKSLIQQVKLLEKEVDALSKQFVENHIERLKTKDCEPKSGVIFTDMIIDLERSSDHAKNVAYAIIAESRRNKKINKNSEGKK